MIMAGIGGVAVGAAVMQALFVAWGAVRRRRAKAQIASPLVEGYVELADIGSHSRFVPEQNEVERETPKSNEVGTDQ